jgi:uncharacterized protein YggL (DUF469 family)
MTDRKLTSEMLKGGPTHERFNHLLHRADLTEPGRERVNEAVQAAIDHVIEKRGLQYGMQGQHVEMALHFLEKHYYKDHRDITDKEKEVIKKLFEDRFGIKDEPPEPDEELKEAV